MTYDELITLINAFRAETQQNAITPDSLGQLLKKMVDYVQERDIETTLEEALEQIHSALDDAKDNIDEEEQDAIEAIEAAISGIDVTYETIDDEYVQLKNGDGDLLMPKTKAKNVEINSVERVTVDGSAFTIKYYWGTTGVVSGAYFSYYPTLIPVKAGDVIHFEKYMMYGSATGGGPLCVIFNSSAGTSGTRYNVKDYWPEGVSYSSPATFDFVCPKSGWLGVNFGKGSTATGLLNFSFSYPTTVSSSLLDKMSDIESEVNDISEDLDDVQTDVSKLIPDIVRNSFSGRYVDTDITAMCQEFTALFNDSGDIESFMFFSDPHLLGTSGWLTDAELTKFIQYMTLAAKYYNSLPMNFVISGGDWLNNSATQDEALMKLGFLDASMRSLFRRYYPANGNHDTNYYGKLDSESANYTGTFTFSELRNVMFRENGNRYYEFHGCNTRFFVFDTWRSDTGYVTSTNYASIADYKAQAKWLASALLNNTDEHIVLVTHQYYRTSDYTINPLAKELNIIALAFNSRSSVTVDGVAHDYSSATGKIHIILAGHNHETLIIEGSSEQIPVYIAPNMQNGNTPTFDLCLLDYTSMTFTAARVGTNDDENDGNLRIINLAN